MFSQICEDFKTDKADYMAQRAEALGIEVDEISAMVDRYYHDVEKEAMRRAVLDEGKRLDGRKTTDIRPIWCEVGPLPGPHGSSIFTRGETQSLSTVTLGTSRDEKMIDEALIQGSDRFLLHYNFPPFSTGEARPTRGVGRREIGHGNLACRALKNMIPEDFPYSIRVVSDILESNGSRLHGYRLRRYARPHGRRCTDEEARQRYRYGTDLGEQGYEICYPLGHPRR